MASVTAEEKQHLKVLAHAAREEESERARLAGRAFTGRKARAIHAIPKGKTMTLLNQALAAKGLTDVPDG